MANQLTIGGLTVSNNVIATVVTVAAEKVDGVAYVNGHNVATSLVSLFTQRPTVTDDTVTCDVQDDKLVIGLPVAVFFGYTFTELAEEIRQAVAEAVTTQVGVDVAAVNVRIDELIFPKE